MSAKATFWAWEQPIEHTATKMVLLCLCDHANEDDYCFPSVAGIMRRTFLSESSVRNAIIKLEATGYLKKNSRFRDTGGQTSNGFSICIGNINCTLASPGFATPPALEQGGEGLRGKGGGFTTYTQGGLPRTPLESTSIESTTLTSVAPNLAEVESANEPQQPSFSLKCDSSHYPLTHVPPPPSPKKERKRNPMLDYLAVEFYGSIEAMNDQTWGKCAGALAQLKQSEPNLTLESLKEGVRMFRQKKPTWTEATPMALPGFWPFKMGHNLQSDWDKLA